MKGLGEQMRDMKYLVSSENTSASRGFYRFYAITSIVLIVVGIILFVMSVIGKLSGAIKILGFGFLPVALVFIFAIMALLSKND